MSRWLPFLVSGVTVEIKILLSQAEQPCIWHHQDHLMHVSFLITIEVGPVIHLPSWE